MKRSNKHLSLTVIFGTAIALTGCLANPGNKNSSFNSTPNNGYNSYNSSYVPQVNIDDLRNTNDGYARQQLYARGFNEVGNNLWSNTRTNQCYQLISINGNVATIVGNNPQNCSTPPNSGYNNNPNYNQNQGYNNTSQSVSAQAPAGLSDLVGAKARQAEADLVTRGYVLRKANGLTAYWEETASGNCVSILTNNGRYQSLINVAPSACR